MLEKFAEELKKAREDKKFSLIQIAAKTRLDLKFLEEMEKGNFSFLPELYVKAFIKEYAKMLDLNEAITLKKYEAAKRGKEYDEKGDTPEEVQIKKQKQEKEISAVKTESRPSFNAADTGYESPEVSETSLKKKKQKLIIYSAAGAVVVLVVIYFAFIRSSTDIIVSEKPYDEVKQSSQERYVDEAPKAVVPDSTATAVMPADSLTLEIDALDTSWVKILLDNSKVEEFTLFPHSKKEIKAKKNYIIVVGNSAVTHFALNNKPLEFSGKKKEVKYISVDSTGLKYLTTPPNFGN